MVTIAMIASCSDDWMLNLAFKPVLQQVIDLLLNTNRHGKQTTHSASLPGIDARSGTLPTGIC